MAARSLHETGEAPPCVDQPDIFRQVRSGEAVLAADDWQSAYCDRMAQVVRPTGWRDAAE
jgi:hypothetical protein